MTIEANSNDFRCYPLGDSAIVIQFADEISIPINQKIRAIGEFLDEYTFEGFVEYVPAFSSITIYYQPSLISFQELETMVQEMMEDLPEATTGSQSAAIEIPVVYGGEWGPDLEFVAQHNKLSIEEIIHIHSSTEYLVYMIGFAPGFPYLGGMDSRIATPRKETPTSSISAGSVGIAGMQTGVYPIETPGGWQIIGRTTIDLFDKESDTPVLLKAGDRIRFVPVEADILMEEIYGI
ncbi:5-oxoprolinase subunit PxpB [Pedobacter psychroterrae]|uniref:5-oxoprolinase subunit PxpB n=1 Tax=Pedobacter psychroterrae TaxID=2530453 RepID=A0A4R0NAZ3_9SPHI|nr:5-oxoprolinase subunit PxpB [Pedobacter psychroterrae]TCC97420.1 5-oxoprolinase subunit PxpB [Pedobacter psychroterrae]